MSQKIKAPAASQEQLEQKKLSVNTTASQSNELDETCSRTTDMQDLRPTYYDANTLSWGDLLSQSLVVFLTSLEITSAPTALIDFHSATQDSNFNAYLFKTQAKIVKCYQNIFDRNVKKYK